MMTGRDSEAQIIGVQKQIEAGCTVTDAA